MACSNTGNTSGDTHHLSEVRIVLLGCRASGKSSAGNTILGRDAFDLQGAAQCVVRLEDVAGRKITVVEAPGWQRDKALKNLLKQEIVLSMSMCPPGPHAVLLVMRLDYWLSWENEDNTLIGYMKYLTERVWSHCIVLFTFGDRLRDQTIEQLIESKGKELKWLMEKCGNRYHVFDNNNRNDNTQVTELLEKIEKMVSGNKGCHMEIDKNILQNMEQRKKAEEERSKERMMKVKQKREDNTEQFYKSHLSEVRIVLLGYRNAGKSSSGNTILGSDKFEFKQSAVRVTREGHVGGRKITVIEAPGWQKSCNSHSTKLLKHEIVLSMLMSPHAVLLVVCLDFRFRGKKSKALVEHLDFLSTKIWSHTIVLFTFGDSLGDTTIERYIESEGQALQWLVEKCGNRYHVFNNKKRDDDSQVSELLEKIEEMVAENSGHPLRSGALPIHDYMGIERKRMSIGKDDSDMSPFQASLHSQAKTLPPDYSPSVKDSSIWSTASFLAALHSQAKTLPPDYSPSVKDSSRSKSGIGFPNFALHPLSTPRKHFSEKSVGTSDFYDLGHESRILHLYAGMFMCKFSDLVFEMNGPAEVRYKIVSWDSCVLDGLCHMQTAGPLYRIECHQGSISRLHLPHCETRTDGVQLTVAHMTGGNAEILQPIKVTDTHVIIDVEHLSLFGLLKAMIFPAFPIKAQVLLFYGNMRKLHIHLLPENVPIGEVQKIHKAFTYIPTSSKCQLTPKSKYRLCCKTTDCDYVSQPEDETFDCDFGPNYHPTFEVLFKTQVNKVTLSLLDENAQEVWKPRTALLPGTSKALTRRDLTGADFVDQFSSDLIQKVYSVMEIADCLKTKNMITDEMYSNIRVQPTAQEKMRELYTCIDSRGTAVKNEFYNILKKKEYNLVVELMEELMP